MSHSDKADTKNGSLKKDNIKREKGREEQSDSQSPSIVFRLSEL